MEVGNLDAQSEVIRAASSHGSGWVSARDIWADERVRKACADEFALLDLILSMYARGLLFAGVPGGVLSVWASGRPPAGSRIVSLQTL